MCVLTVSELCKALCLESFVYLIGLLIHDKYWYHQQTDKTAKTWETFGKSFIKIKNKTGPSREPVVHHV